MKKSQNLKNGKIITYLFIFEKLIILTI